MIQDTFKRVQRRQRLGNITLWCQIFGQVRLGSQVEKARHLNMFSCSQLGGVKGSVGHFLKASRRTRPSTGLGLSGIWTRYCEKLLKEK